MGESWDRTMRIRVGIHFIEGNWTVTIFLSKKSITCIGARVTRSMASVRQLKGIKNRISAVLSIVMITALVLWSTNLPSEYIFYTCLTKGYNVAIIFNGNLRHKNVLNIFFHIFYIFFFYMLQNYQKKAVIENATNWIGH